MKKKKMKKKFEDSFKNAVENKKFSLKKNLLHPVIASSSFSLSLFRFLVYNFYFIGVVVLLHLEFLEKKKKQNKKDGGRREEKNKNKMLSNN